MRDIQMVLERWGAWAANNHEDVTCDLTQQ